MKRTLSVILCAAMLVFSMAGVSGYAEGSRRSDRIAIPSFIESVIERLTCSLRDVFKFDFNKIVIQQPDVSKDDETSKEREEDEKAEEIQENKPSEESKETSISLYEREVVRLVNIERSKYSLSELRINEDLCELARLKSTDMRDNKYFAHQSPTYGSAFDMMKKKGITYRTAGENIAMGYDTPESVVSAWMNSPGHRANILNSSYKEIGVGYVESGSYCTQMFIG